MITKFKEIWGKTDDIILRYPMVLTTALIAAISAVVAIEIDHQDNQFLVTKLAFAGCLGISLMFGIKMLSQRIGKGFLLEILGAAFSGLVLFLFARLRKTIYRSKWLCDFCAGHFITLIRFIFRIFE
ncbi:MAG: hypothetical protein U0T78_01790 [Cloacibacterium normanense]